MTTEPCAPPSLIIASRKTSPKVALITGVAGHAYRAERLLSKDYIVPGIKRRTSQFSTGRIDHLHQDPHETPRRFILHDMTDSSSLIRIIRQVQPDEIYNLAAQSHVAVSFEGLEYAADSDGLGSLRTLEAIRIPGLKKNTRPYQASTSELLGLVSEVPPRETTPFSIRATPMQSPSCFAPTGSPSTTTKPMASMPATALPISADYERGFL